jgi:hypothetical protein
VISSSTLHSVVRSGVGAGAVGASLGADSADADAHTSLGGTPTQNSIELKSVKTERDRRPSAGARTDERPTKTPTPAADAKQPAAGGKGKENETPSATEAKPNLARASTIAQAKK